MRTLAETACIVFVAWIISVGAHEMTHVVHVGSLGLDIQRACLFGVGTMDKDGTMYLMNGWVMPDLHTQEEFELWEANREMSEYNAYFVQGVVLTLAVILISTLVERRSRERQDKLRELRIVNYSALKDRACSPQERPQ